MQYIFASHQPKAILPEVTTSGDSGLDKNTRNNPPGGKINFPFSTSTKVVSGSALRSKALIPPVGSFKKLVAYCSFIFGCGRGDIAVFDGVTNSDLIGVSEGLELNQNWAKKEEFETSVIVHTLT
ncbi:MAG: hypothetical protein WBG45_12230 [Paenisporosarcina sp.]